jgi:N-acylneuraminate cytidylyltransferase/CMP-N,N'-diacetyllegionaminic acid synthase
MGKEVLCIIPARGGSKGITRKNIVSVAGKPLIYYSISAALGSESVSRVVVSTEDDEIAKVARGFGADVPFFRPEELAEDEVHSVFPVIYTVRRLQETEGYLPDAVLMLLPTCPLTRPHHISEAVALFFSNRPGAVISVSKFNKPLSSIRKVVGDQIKPVTTVEDFNVQRQDYNLYVVNAAMYIATPRNLFDRQTFHLDNVHPYVMADEDSLDINSPTDLRMADFLLSQQDRK